MASIVNRKDKGIAAPEISTSDIVTLLQDLSAKVDAIQRTQAAMKPDIIEHIFLILKQRWSDEAAKRRERCW